MPKKFLSICFVALIGVMPTVAQASEWVESNHMRARLAAVPDGGSRMAILEIELEEGWHTYGQEPGDAGLPPRFDWTESTNLESVEVSWPDTIQKREMDMFTVNAYEGQVQFPLAVIPSETGNDVTLDLGLKVMVCNNICIPNELEIFLPLKAVQALEPSP